MDFGVVQFRTKRVGWSGKPARVLRTGCGPGPGRQPGVYRGAGAGVCQAVEEYDIAWYEEPCTVWITLAIVTCRAMPNPVSSGEFL